MVMSKGENFEEWFNDKVFQGWIEYCARREASKMKKAKEIIEGLSEQKVKALLNEAIKEMATTLVCSTTCPKYETCEKNNRMCKRLILDELAEKAGVLIY